MFFWFIDLSFNADLFSSIIDKVAKVPKRIVHYYLFFKVNNQTSINSTNKIILLGVDIQLVCPQQQKNSISMSLGLFSPPNLFACF